MWCNPSVAPPHPNLVVAKGGKPCKLKRTYVITGLCTGGDYRVYNSNFSALERAVKERVFFVKKDGEFTVPSRPTVAQFNILMSDFTCRFDRLAQYTTPMSAFAFAEQYQGRRRAVYIEAAKLNQEYGFEDKFAHVRAFVKTEKYCFGLKEPVPRLIQPRQPRYLLESGRYNKPIEKKIFRAIDKVFNNVTVYKGLNMDQRGQELHKAWCKYNKPVAIGIDASRFDQHVSNAALRWEHHRYQKYYRGDSYFTRLCGLQRSNKCTGHVSDGWVKYHTIHNRMSGDHNTTTGNVLIMCGAVFSYFRKYGIVASLVNDGDDCVIICERKHERLILNTLPSFFLELGFTMVVEPPVYVFERIEFCQAQPILTNRGTYRMVRSIDKAMSKDAVSLYPFEGSGARRWMAAVGQGGVALGSSIPIVQEYYACLHRNAKGANPLSHPTLVTGLFYCRQGMTGHYEDVTDESRLSFFLAFGVTPAEQIATEEYFRTLELTEGSLANRFAILPLANGGRITV